MGKKQNKIHFSSGLAGCLIQLGAIDHFCFFLWLQSYFFFCFPSTMSCLMYSGFPLYIVSKLKTWLFNELVNMRHVGSPSPSVLADRSGWSCGFIPSRQARKLVGASWAPAICPADVCLCYATRRTTGEGKSRFQLQLFVWTGAWHSKSGSASSVPHAEAAQQSNSASVYRYKHVITQLHAN